MLLKLASWASLIAILFVLLFTSTVLEALGMTNDIASVVLVVSPLIVLAVALEWISRRQAQKEG